MTRRSSLEIVLPILSSFLVAPVWAQSHTSPLEGMWSDPPANPMDFFCFGFCTDAGLEHLAALLDDPANDERPFLELRDEAKRYEVMQYFGPRLSAAARESFPLDELDDPGYLECEPWGLARQMFAPHQLELRHFPDRIEMQYGEWDARRTVYLDPRSVPDAASHTRLGHSVGHYEGDALVIETTGVSANITMWRSRHSDRLKVIERYTRDGDRLLLTATMEDAWGLKEPIMIKKVWSWAPDQEIFPYVDCEPAEKSAPKGD